MKIPDITGRLQSLPPREPERPLHRTIQSGEAKRQNAQGDELDLSAAALNAAAEVNADHELPDGSEISETRIKEIRERIARGFFENPAVTSAVTARLVEFYTK